MEKIENMEKIDALQTELGQFLVSIIPVPWEKVMERAVERYTRLVALGKEGKLKDKKIRII